MTKSNPTFSWSSSEAANFTCGIDNSFNLVDCGHGLNGQWTGKNIPDGEHVFVFLIQISLAIKDRTRNIGLL